MSDLLKSAFGYFNSNNVTESDHNFVGQVVEIGNVKLVVKEEIAEGILIKIFQSFQILICKND